jgi:hypothetical protein
MVGLLSNDVFVYECIQSYRLYTKLSIVRLAENICPREKNIGQSDMDFLVDRIEKTAFSGRNRTGAQKAGATVAQYARLRRRGRLG